MVNEPPHFFIIFFLRNDASYDNSLTPDRTLRVVVRLIRGCRDWPLVRISAVSSIPLITRIIARVSTFNLGRESVRVIGISVSILRVD